MTVVLELKPEIEEALQKKAKANGFEVNIYLEKLIEKDIDQKKTIDELLAPVRQDFEESGMSEEELNDFFDDLRDKVWQEKQNADK
ncbi:MAG: transcription initiation factor IIA subunit 1 family protein [Acidobacteriota bacterium]|nr:transcription initiation factor IIA subunit 1 family protein [Acidobacteriota bacterium]